MPASADSSPRWGQDVSVMKAMSAHAWWLLPGAVALVAVAVIDLRGGQLSGTAVDVGTGIAWYLAAAVAYMARPASRTAWLFLLMATVLEGGKALGAGVSLGAASNPAIAHAWATVLLLNAAAWALTAAGIALFASYPDGKYQRPYERLITRALPAAFVPLQLLQLLGSARIGTNQFGWTAVDAPSPLYIRGFEPVGAAAGAVIDASILVVVPALVLLVLRYRRFGTDQRRQIKWPLYAIALSAISVVVLAVGVGPPAIPYWLAALQYVGTQAILPAGLAMGIVMPTAALTSRTSSAGQWSTARCGR